MTINDPLSVHELNLRCLLKKLGKEHPHYQEALVYQQRLMDNINHARRFGDSNNLKSERAEIIDHLNHLSLSVWGIPFAELCPESDVELPRPRAETPVQTDEQPYETAWKWTLRIVVFLAGILSVLWLVFEPGFEPLIATITSVSGLVTYLVLSHSRSQQYLDRFLAIILVFLALILVSLFVLSKEPSNPIVTVTVPAIRTTINADPSVLPPTDQLDTSLLVNLAIADFSHLQRTIQENSRLRTFLYHPAPALSLAVYDQVLAAGYEDGSLILWDLNAGQTLGHPRGSESEAGVWSLAFSPDGQMLAAGIADGTILLWDVTTQQQIGSVTQGHHGVVSSVAFGPNGATLVSGGADGAIIFWTSDLLQQQASMTQAHVAPVWRIAFHPDGNWLASAGEDGQIILWDVATREPVQQWSQGFGIKTLVFNVDGTQLLVGNNHGQIDTYDVSGNNDHGIPLAEQASAITGMALSPDGRMLAAGSCVKREAYGFCRQGEVRLWQMDSGQPDASPISTTVLKGEVWDVVFSADGKFLVATSPDGVIPVWFLDPPLLPSVEDWTAWEARACKMANRNLTESEWQMYLPGEPYRLLCPGLPAVSSSLAAPETGLLLLAEEGRVEWKTEGMEKFVPASPGTNLLAGDELRLEPAMAALLLCEDMTVFQIPEGIYPIGAHCVSPREDVNLLVDWQGELTVKRANWTDSRPAAPHMVLHRGDILSLSVGGNARLLCENGDYREMPAGVTLDVRDICPRGIARLGDLEDSSRGTRGDTDPLIPYIISPRMTHLLTRQPTLRWHEAPGATLYTVRIVGLNWETETSETYVNGADVPPLQEGEIYLLIVETDNDRSSREEGVPGLGFLLLPEAEATVVQKAQADIMALGLPPESEALTLAHLYIEYDLLAEAIEYLSAVVDAGTQTAAIYRLLGALCRQIGLPLMAESQYLQAISLAQNENEIDGLALYQAELGEIYLDLGDKVEAVRWFEAARRNYEILGDAQQAEDVIQKVEDLK